MSSLWNHTKVIDTLLTESTPTPIHVPNQDKKLHLDFSN